jgi:protein TonB
MALSFALHGLAVLPLFLIAGTLGSTSSQEPALFLEFAVAAPTVGPNAEPDGAPTEETPSPPEPPAPTLEAAVQPPEPALPLEKIPEPDVVPEIKVDLPLPEEPPPLKATDLKPVEPPKPTPPKPAPPRPSAKPANVAQAATAPDAGNAAVTQQATTAPGESIVWEGQPRYRIPPKPAVYPKRAIELGQQGEVLVRVRLDPDGSAAEIRLWRGSGFDLLDRAALAAVRGWHFLPAMRGGRPVAAWVEIPVRFHLH